MEEAADEKNRRFRGSVACIGSWHTHPTTGANPSKVDIQAVAQLLGAPASTRRTFVLLILSGSPDDPVLGAHAFRRILRAQEFVCIEHGTAATTLLGRELTKPREVGACSLRWGIPGYRFPSLGCLRALNDLGLLDRLQVISSVSGGSIISAVYAYSNDSFSKFDARVVEMLRQGLNRSIVKAALRPSSVGKTVWSLAVAVAVSAFRTLLRLTPLRSTLEGIGSGKPPPIRRFSRSEAFRNVMESFFGHTLMRDVARNSLDIVVNATELRTGSAFRFGSKQSGCWRFGTIVPKDALVADAVAASAAYPALLPVLDRRYQFTREGARSTPTRVLLTDGGVFENLGVGPMEPGREPRISTNVFKPTYIISCDAGTGLFDDDSYPMWWPRPNV